VSEEFHLTLGISYDIYSQSPSVTAVYNRAFERAVTALAGYTSPLNVAVTRVQKAPSGTALSFVFISQHGADSFASSYATLMSQLGPNSFSTFGFVGSLTITSVAAGGVQAPPPQALFTSAVYLDIAFDVPYASWNVPIFNPAVEEVLARLLGLPTQDVLVYAADLASFGGTAVRLSIAQPVQNFEFRDDGVSIDTSSFAFGKLFGDGNGFETATGAAALPPLVDALQATGLPITTAYFADQPAPVSRKALTSPRRVLA